VVKLGIGSSLPSISSLWKKSCDELSVQSAEPFPNQPENPCVQALLTKSREWKISQQRQEKFVSLLSQALQKAIEACCKEEINQRARALASTLNEEEDPIVILREEFLKLVREWEEKEEPRRWGLKEESKETPMS